MEYERYNSSIEDSKEDSDGTEPMNIVKIVDFTVGLDDDEDYFEEERGEHHTTTYRARDMNGHGTFVAGLIGS